MQGKETFYVGSLRWPVDTGKWLKQTNETKLGDRKTSRRPLVPLAALVMVYLPSARPVTLAMSKLSGPVSARWFDPTSGSYMPISGSPFSPIDRVNLIRPELTSPAMMIGSLSSKLSHLMIRRLSAPGPVANEQ